METPSSKRPIRVSGKPETPGAARRSAELRNDSKETLTVYLERVGSDHFDLHPSSRKLTLKPGASKRVRVEFHAPEAPFVMALGMTHSALIKVWARRGKKGAERELVEVFRVTDTGPGLVSPDSIRCFDPAD